MRRFSQKNSLVTLNEINITPLLDLAFVLLIIFIITTPLLEQSIKLDLPSGGAAGTTFRKDEVRTVEVDRNGTYVVQKRRMNLNELRNALVQESRVNPAMKVYIRADNSQAYGDVVPVFDICAKNKIKIAYIATSLDK